MATRTAAPSAARSARVKSARRTENTRAPKQTSAASRLSRHQRKCFICHHPDREIIEEMFIHWQSPMSIYSRFMLRDRRTIYDHAHALGLFAKRRRNMRCALERIIERADECDVSAHGIVAALKAYASLSTSGEWVEPARHVTYTSVSAPAPQREISNPLANQNGRRAYSRALIDPSVTGDGWYTRNENPPANKNGRGVYSAPSNEPDLTGDGWYTRNDKTPPATYSAPQTAAQHSSAPSHTSTTATPTNSHGPDPAGDRATTSQTANSNRYSSGLEIPATHTKQTPAPHPNRYK